MIPENQGIRTVKKYSNKTIEQKAAEQLRCYRTIQKASFWGFFVSLLAEAYRDDVIFINPLDKVERPKHRKDEQTSEIKALTVEDARRLLKLLDAEPFQWQAVIRLMLDTGCRRGEICGLRWADVDFKQNQITVKNNLQYTKANGIFETSTKGGKTRTIDIDPAIMSLLK